MQEDEALSLFYTLFPLFYNLHVWVYTFVHSILNWH